LPEKIKLTFSGYKGKESKWVQEEDLKVQLMYMNQEI
jgi:hypothetical protein